LLRVVLTTQQQSQMEVWCTPGAVPHQVNGPLSHFAHHVSKKNSCQTRQKKSSQVNLDTIPLLSPLKMIFKKLLLACHPRKLSKCLKVTATSYIHLFSSIIDMDPQFSFYSLKLIIFLRKPCDKCFVWRQSHGIILSLLLTSCIILPRYSCALEVTFLLAETVTTVNLVTAVRTCK